jgi:cell division cycle 2-like
LQKRECPENLIEEGIKEEEDSHEGRMARLDSYEITKEERDKIMKKRKSNPLSQGCNSIENYLYLNKIHEGSYGIVFRAIDKVTGQTYAIKNVKIERNGRGFPFAALREINALLSISHPNIIRMREVVTGSEMDKIYVVMEYMENELKNLMENMEEGFTVE